ncbi:zinc-finger homeodomain protein 5-like [Vigna umbellata]|uniref:zinc-finger homeodomain protein 5-like n=1 Tax=Vigna umbellata TaxID=87088 RepID=UPI001F5F29B9|nr:zinc-finger homeodomain protein 5-like [Vigna umbellata]
MSSINTSGFTNQVEESDEEEVEYKECRRNHAVAIGGDCYDGCNEYMKPNAERNSQDSFLCACCGCHRNFHRKHNPVQESETENDYLLDVVPFSGTFHPARATDNNNNPEPLQQVRPLRRKRTIFSVEQKNQMRRFADILGWKPHKGNREEIQRFCTDMGISRKIFVVWLNNNRHRAAQNSSQTSLPSST